MSRKFWSIVLMLLVSSSIVFAQDGGTTLPDDKTNLIVVRSTVIATSDGTIIRLSNRDVTDFSNGLGGNPDLAVKQAINKHLLQRKGLQPRATAYDGALAGDAEIGLRADTNIWGRAASYLTQTPSKTRKLEAWAVKLTINGAVNSNGNLNIKYTASAYDRVYSGEMLGWSGCAIIQMGRTNRYALIETDHKLINLQNVQMRRVPNAAIIRYGCLGDA